MQTGVSVTFRGLPASEGVEQRIGEKIAKLEKRFPQLVSCRVAVEGAHHHHHQGNLYHVRIELGVPGRELVVSREQHDRHAREDVYVAVRDAFKAAERQLQDYAQRLRGDIKTHAPIPHGRVTRLMLPEGYGFILSSDGREVYFHRNAVLSGQFDSLEVGTEVRFEEERGDEGPQASTVHLIGKHHLPPG